MGSLLSEQMNIKSKTDLHEIVTHFKLVLLVGNVSLDLGVGVVNDGQEHVKQHEKHEEDVEDEVEWAENSVRSLQLVEVKVSQDDTQQGEPSMSRITS